MVFSEFLVISLSFAGMEFMLCMLAHMVMWDGLDFLYLAALPDLRLRLRVLYGADVADLCYS